MQEKHSAAIWRRSLREHCQLRDKGWSWLACPHWLVASRIGRAALLLKLWQIRPVGLSCLADRSRLDPLLDAMVDAMGLRQMPRPSSLKGRLLCVLKAVLGGQLYKQAQRGETSKTDKGTDDV